MRQLSYSQLRPATRGITFPRAGGDVYKSKRVFLRKLAGDSLGKSCHTSQPVRDYTSAARTPVQRTLQQYLGKGEYPVFHSITMFESTFIQVTRKGRQVFIHNHLNPTIVGIASTNPKLPLPNIMFIARPAVGQVTSGQQTEELMLTRLIPLRFVRISIHDSEKHLIKIKLINRHAFYLQLYSSTGDAQALFNCWLSLVHLLHHPPRNYLRPSSKACTKANLRVRFVPSETDTKLKQDKVREDEMDSLPEVMDSSPDEMDSSPDEMHSLPLEKKATQATFQSQDNILAETFSKSEDHIVRSKSRFLTSNTQSLHGWESFDSYNRSSTAAAEDVSRNNGLLYYLESESDESDLSRCSLQLRPIPERGENSSIEIVTRFSVVSQLADVGESSQK